MTLKIELNFLFFKFITFILSIGVFCLLPIILLLITLFGLLPKYLVAKLAPWVRPDLQKMLPSMSSIIHSIERDFTNPKYNILSNFTPEGTPVDIQELYDRVQNNLLEATFPNGDLKYPELKQYVTTWAGYHFWKWDTKFALKNHIKLCEKSGVKDRFTGQDMLELRQELLNKKWDKKKPLWEFIIVPNYYPSGLEGNPGPFTDILFRVHHSLGDGYSLLSLALNGVFDTCDEFSNAVPASIPRTKFQKLGYLLSAPPCISYKIAEMLVEFPFSNYPFKVESKRQELAKTLIHMTDKLSTSQIKEIKSHFRVSFTSVILAVIAGAIREMLVLKNLPVPEKIPMGMALPVSNHSEKLRNEISIPYVDLPTGEDDPVQLVKISHKNFQNLKNSHFPLAMIWGTKLIGSFCRYPLKRLAENRTFSIGLSNFPAGHTLLEFNGRKIIDHYFTVQQNGCVGIGLCIMSYKEGMRWCTYGSSEMFTKHELAQMSMLIQKQIQMLYHYTAV